MTTRWSVVLPYYNEAKFLPQTLAALTAQTYRPFRLILVDNASTDNSTELAKDFAARHPSIDILFVHEPQPGKIHALEAGLRHVDSEFVALCDADTYYPPHYLGLCDQLFATSSNDVVAVMALGLSEDATRWRERFRRYFYSYIVSRILKYQCHTGGYGQAFRVQALMAAGGYSMTLWPFVLEDHEIMNRVFRFGHSLYHRDLWCISSNRRTEHSKTSWSLPERLMYHLMPYRWKDWFFYTFLKARFAARQLNSINLRIQRAWE